VSVWKEVVMSSASANDDAPEDVTGIDPDDDGAECLEEAMRARDADAVAAGVASPVADVSFGVVTHPTEALRSIARLRHEYEQRAHDAKTLPRSLGWLVVWSTLSSLAVLLGLERIRANRDAGRLAQLRAWLLNIAATASVLIAVSWMVRLGLNPHPIADAARSVAAAARSGIAMVNRVAPSWVRYVAAFLTLPGGGTALFVRRRVRAKRTATASADMKSRDEGA